MTERTPLWTPSRESIENSELFRYQQWLNDARNVQTSGYAELWNWSVNNIPEFWETIWQYFEVLGQRGDGPALTGDEMPAVSWYPGVTLNYAENILRFASIRPDAEAVVGVHEDDRREVLTWRELAGQVGALSAKFREVGVRPGDCICGVLPHIPGTVVALLACASVGAIWSVVSPDFGIKGIADRFAQIEPKVLLTVDGYRFNGKLLDMTGTIGALEEALPTVEHHVLVDQLDREIDPSAVPAGSFRLSEIVADAVDPVFTSVEFSHPLWALYSSGTTGKPKGIVHSHGGVVLEAIKANALQYDICEGDRVYFAVSTTWVVWNLVVDALIRGATIVTYDGSPVWGTPAKQLEICADEKITMFGTGAAVLTVIEKSGISPADRYNLSALRAILTTGSPLPDSTWDWVYAHVNENLRLGSDSGGTDIASGFIGSNPFDPVYRGELQGAYLGVSADSFNSAGESVVGEVGEFVVTAPMPSMPVKFWNDPEGSRYREAYFDVFPGVWRHGDWVTKLAGGQYIIHGRSDSTINRGGIRMGSADICQVVDAVPGVQASMVIGAELEGGDYYMPLFVVPTPGTELTEELKSQIVNSIRTDVSPRYVPDEIIAAPAVPTTRTGKLMEIPIKRVFQGAAPGTVNRASAADADVLDWYVDYAQSFARSRTDE